MRPRSNALRYAYRAAAAKIRSDNREVTTRSLAEELETAFKAVQRFLYIDKALAQEIGVVPMHEQHDFAQYADAIASIPSTVRPTLRRIGEKLGLDHSSVARFLENHPTLRGFHPRFDEPRKRRAVAKTVKSVPVEPEAAIPPPEEIEDIAPAERWWNDILVSVWHENAGRYVGEGVSRDKYLEYWRHGRLKHQREGKQKPEHLPTPEEVALMR